MQKISTLSAAWDHDPSNHSVSWAVNCTTANLFLKNAKHLDRSSASNKHNDVP
jgi:hypothetical protein